MRDLYIQANEIRKTHKKCAFILNGKLMLAKGPDDFVEVTPEILSKINRWPSTDKYVPDLLKNFDGHLLELDRCFDAGYYIEDFNIVMLADAIARLFLIPDVHYWKTVLYIYGKGYTHKMDVYDALPTILLKDPVTLKSLVTSSNKGVYVQEYGAVLLDDIAYVARNYTVYSCMDPEKYTHIAMFGHIHNGELQWMKVDNSHFTQVKTEGGKEIEVLTCKLREVDTVLRRKSITDLSKVKKFAYPIAILEDSELSYYAKMR